MHVWWIFVLREYAAKGRCSSHLLCLFEDAFSTRARGDIGYVLTRDWAVKNRAFVFDLSPWGDEKPLDDPGQRLLFGVFFAACALAMATDLDQRLIPDVITLPLIVLGAAALVWGGDSLVSRSPAWTAILGAVAVPGLMLAASLPFGEGTFGGADVKFIVSVGLLTGLIRIAIAAFAGAMIAGVVVVALLLARRVTLKSYVPFGPFLILGAVWAVLLPASS